MTRNGWSFGLVVPLLATAGARGDEVVIPPEVRAAESARIALIERIAPAVVCMLDENKKGGGAGILIDPAGYGLSNFHVVARSMETRRGFGGLADGTAYPMEILGVDVTGDVAMFKLTGSERFDAVSLGDSDRMRIGDPVLVMGDPFAVAWDYTASVSRGIVSGVHRYQKGAGDRLVYTDCIQVDAAVNPGNSGGGLFNHAGKLVGIIGRASFAERGRVSVGLGYAISANQIRRFIPGLRAGLHTFHGTLDATVTDAPEGVIFNAMHTDSIAAEMGIELGDTLLRFDGYEIRSANQFASLLGTYPDGWPVSVDYRRGDQERSVELRLSRLPVTLDAPIPVDREQNLAEVRRTLERFKAAVGGAERIADVVSIGWTGVREHLEQSQRVTMSQPVRLELEKVSPASPVHPLAWNLTDHPEPEDEPSWTVVGADAHEGEIVQVLEHRQPDGGRIYFAFDETCLLRRVQVAFEEGEIARVYTYDGYQDVDGLRLPRRMGAAHDVDRQFHVDIVEQYVLERRM